MLARLRAELAAAQRLTDEALAVVHGEYVYATLDFAPVDGARAPSDDVYRQLPQGWELAPKGN